MGINKSFSSKILGLFFIVATLGVVACSNDEDPTVAELVFIDLDSNLVPGVNVTLQCTSSLSRPCDINIEGTTDQGGKYRRTFEEPKILNVTGAILTDVIVDYDTNLVPIYQQDSLFVTGTINIKKFQTNRKVFQMDTIK